MKKKTDANQKKIIDALRSCGASVQDTSAVGQGFPDLVVGFCCKNYLIEVKNPEGKNKTTPEQDIWHFGWKGQKAIVRNVEEALAVIGVKVQ